MPPFTLPFDDPPCRLSPDVTCTDFADSPLGQDAALKLDGMRTRFLLDRCTSAGRTFQATFTFQARSLAQIELFLVLPGEKGGWENWTQENERRRKQEGERWLADAFGQAPTVLPIELDGQQITPFQPGWDAVTGVRFEGGEARSFFDSKAGFAGLFLRFSPD